MADDYIARLWREQARRIAAQLGDKVGNREALILVDPEVRVTRSAAFPGCWVLSTRTDSMVYRTRDNAIVN